MADKCRANYKNLNRIQSFSEQSYATVQLMQQACMNDEWLRQQVEKLNYLTPPAVRKRFTPVNVDESQSWGYTINSNNQVTFSSATEDTVYVDFTDDNLIDHDKSDAVIEQYVIDEVEPASTATIDDEIPDANDTSDKAIKRRCVLPSTTELETTEATWDLTTRTTTGGGYNSAWYVGFNKSKTYYVRPDWIKDWRDLEIPSVCRAQTFKATSSGKLASVDLKLAYNGTQSSNCGSPLYVQIWKTVKKFVVKTTWNNKTHKSEHIYIKDPKDGKYDKYQHYEKKDNGTYAKKQNGEYVLQREYIYWPDTKNSGIWKPLAQAVYDPKTMDKSGFPNIQFDNPCKITRNHHYAIVLFSPLSEWKHCPRWAGWGRNCARDQKYKYGDAFFSENNGRTWERHGRNDEKVQYKQGKWTPQDFAFQCHIMTKDAQTTSSLVYSSDTHYLYLKPIYSNPITHVSISAYDSGDIASDSSVNVQYQVSTTGNKDDWHTMTNAEYQLAAPSKVLFVRAKLWRSTDMQEDGSDANAGKTPIIENIRVNMKTQVPDEMYVRTHMYHPPTDPMLGANLWGRVYAPFTTEPTVNCTMEIIKDSESKDHFYITSVSNVDSLMEANELSVSDLAGKTFEQRVEYFNSHPDLLETLKKHNIYIKPAYIDSTYYKLSFKPVLDGSVTETDDMLAGIKFSNNVSYPILGCELKPDGGEDIVTYGEWYDFKFDYTENTLTFNKTDLDEMPLGGLEVRYNPIFIDGLTSEELGLHVDSETGLTDEGIILDYFKETITVTDTELETRRVSLRTQPTDPIRSVVLNKDTDDEKELHEDVDFYLDIDTNELVFEVNNEDGVSSILNLGDSLEIVYTPYLTTPGISLGYHATRTNKDKQVYIDGNYIEYKA